MEAHVQKGREIVGLNADDVMGKSIFKGKQIVFWCYAPYNLRRQLK